MNAKNTTQAQINNLKRQSSPVTLEYNRLEGLKNEAQTAVNNATTAYQNALAAKEATDRKLAEERRAKIAEDYKKATALKEATVAELNEFKL